MSITGQRPRTQLFINSYLLSSQQQIQQFLLHHRGKNIQSRPPRSAKALRVRCFPLSYFGSCITLLDLVFLLPLLFIFYNMPPSARSHKGSSPRRKALHPYQRPLPSALAAQPAASDTEQKSLNKQDKQHVSDASIHLSAPGTSSLQGSGRRKKKNKRKKNKNTRAMQSDAIKSSYAPPTSPLSPSRPLLNKYGTQVTPPISQSGISEVAILPTKHNTDLATSQPSSNAGPVNDKARAANLDRDIIRLREEARKREAIHIELYKAQEEAGRLREKVENLTKHEDELKARVEELQRIVEVNNKKTEILDTVSNALPLSLLSLWNLGYATT